MNRQKKKRKGSVILVGSRMSERERRRYRMYIQALKLSSESCASDLRRSTDDVLRGLKDVRVERLCAKQFHA